MNPQIKVVSAFFGVLVLLFAPPLPAASVIMPTLEWITCVSDVVAVGKIVSVKTIQGPGDRFYEECELDVSEVIKGSVGHRLSFCYRHDAGEKTSWKDTKGEVLVCLSVDAESDRDEPGLKGRLGNLREFGPLAVIDLKKPVSILFNALGEQLTTRVSVLRVAHAAADALAGRRAKDPKFDASSRWIEVPSGSDAGRTLSTLSSNALKVPEFMFPGPSVFSTP